MVLVKGRKTKGKLTCTNEGPYRLIAYNGDRTMVRIKDAAGKEWTEAIGHIQPFDGPIDEEPC
jgi:hypothetical protein